MGGAPTDQQVAKWAHALEIGLPFATLAVALVAFRPTRSALWDWCEEGHTCTRGVLVSTAAVTWVAVVNLAFGVPLTGANALTLTLTATNAVCYVCDEMLSRTGGLQVLHVHG